MPAAGTRPTSDRVRESLFSSLEHRADGVIGKRVLDLFAGSGALGLEALSRGAETAVLVERDRRACEVVRANIERAQLAGAQLICDDVFRLVSTASTRGQFDLVFLDPPYELDDERVAAVLLGLVEGQWLAANATVLVERSARTRDLRWPHGFSEVERRAYGDTVVLQAFWYGPNEARSRASNDAEAGG